MLLHGREGMWTMDLPLLEMIIRGAVVSAFVLILREHGVEFLEQVKWGVLETNGKVSVIRFEGNPAPPAERESTTEGLS